MPENIRHPQNRLLVMPMLVEGPESACCRRAAPRGLTHLAAQRSEYPARKGRSARFWVEQFKLMLRSEARYENRWFIFEEKKERRKEKKKKRKRRKKGVCVCVCPSLTKLVVRDALKKKIERGGGGIVSSPPPHPDANVATRRDKPTIKLACTPLARAARDFSRVLCIATSCGSSLGAAPVARWKKNPCNRRACLCTCVLLLDALLEAA